MAPSVREELAWEGRRLITGLAAGILTLLAFLIISPASAAGDKDHLLTISIRADGSIFVGKREVAFSRFAPRVRDAAGASAATQVFVRADVGAPYAVITRLMTALSSAGFNSIDLVADPDFRAENAGAESREPPAL